MNVTINIDDDTLSDLIKKGIAGLSEATIGTIAKEAVERAFSDKEVVEGLLFKKESGWGGTTQLELRSGIVDMLMKSFNDEDLARYRKLMLDTLDEKGGDLVIDALSRTLARKLFDEQYGLINDVYNELRATMEGRR